jgi:DNA-binding NtrC family response regulator
MNSDTGQRTGETILVVDDETLVNTILARYLSQAGYDCLTAQSGHEALEKLGERPSALALCDIRMPGMDGIELLRRIKQFDDEIAVIMVSAVDNREVAVEAMRAGAYDYVIKPFHLEEVLISVQRALENRRLVLERKEYQRDLERRVENWRRRTRSWNACSRVP